MAKRTSRLATWIAMAALLASTPLAAQTGGSNHVWARDSMGPIFDTLNLNAPAQAGSPGISYGSSGHYAVADGAALTWRAAAGQRREGSQDQVQAASQWAVIVQPGTSGLAMGTPLTLTLLLQLDGSADAGLAGGSFADGWTVQAETTALAALDIRNPSAPDWDPETRAPLLSFDARAYAGLWTGSCQQAASCGGSPFAYTRSAGVVDLQASLPGGGSWAWSGNSSTDTTVPVAGSPSRQGVSFNSGQLSFSFPGAVGDQLLIDGEFYIGFFCLGSSGLGTGSLPCTNHADFSNTMRAGLVASVAGIEFEGLTPVPEPPAALLLLAGAGLLLSLRRGTRAAV